MLVSGFRGVLNAPRKAEANLIRASFAGYLFGSFTMPALLIEFEKFPKEKSLVGEMLMAYGEIEFAIVRSIAAFFDKIIARLRAYFLELREKGLELRLPMQFYVQHLRRWI